MVLIWIKDHCSSEFMSARKLLEFKDETDVTRRFWNGYEVTWVDDGLVDGMRAEISLTWTVILSRSAKSRQKLRKKTNASFHRIL